MTDYPAITCPECDTSFQNPPQTIYLQWDASDEVTWCKDPVGAYCECGGDLGDVLYIRAPSPELMERLRLAVIISAGKQLPDNEHETIRVCTSLLRDLLEHYEGKDNGSSNG